jgi:hypothetical protein
MPTVAEARYARLQRKLKLEEKRLARLISRVAMKKKKIEAAKYRSGAFIRNRYLVDPTISRLLAKHGGTRAQTLARLALATGKHHVRPMMNVARNVKAQQNTNITAAKRRYDEWYNSLNANQRRQAARNYMRQTGGVQWYSPVSYTHLRAHETG